MFNLPKDATDLPLIAQPSLFVWSPDTSNPAAFNAGAKRVWVPIACTANVLPHLNPHWLISPVAPENIDPSDCGSKLTCVPKSNLVTLSLVCSVPCPALVKVLDNVVAPVNVTGEVTVCADESARFNILSKTL